MLSQAARGLLSPAFIFGSTARDGEANGSGAQVAVHHHKSAKSRSKNSSNKLANGGQSQQQAQEDTDHQQGRLQNRSSSSGGSSSGYLSQSNGTVQQTRQAPAQEVTISRAGGHSEISTGNRLTRDTNQNEENEDMSHVMQNGRGVRSSHKQRRQKQKHQAATQFGGPQVYHTNNMNRPASLSSASLTMQLQPMMDDEEDESEDDQLNDDDDDDRANQDESLAAAASAGPDLARLSGRHLSYQLMIDGLKRQQRQLQHFVHSCQLDDKLSLSAMMLHNAQQPQQQHLTSQPANGQAQMIGCAGEGIADECADSSDTNSLDQFHHFHHPNNLNQQQQQQQQRRPPNQLHKRFEPSTGLAFGTSTASTNSRPHLRGCECCELGDHSDCFRGKSARRHHTAAIYYQPSSTINTHSDQLHLHDQNQNHHFHCSLPSVAASQQLLQIQHLCNKPQPPLPPPKASEQILRGYFKQEEGHDERQNSSASAALSRPHLSSYLNGHVIASNNNNNNQARSHLLQRTMIQQQSGGGSRQHLTHSPEAARLDQQQVRRSKSNQQQLASGHLHQQQTPGGKLARPVPKSASMMNGPVSVAASQINANLAAIEASNERHSRDQTSPLVLGCCGKLAKFLLFIANLLFWCAGIALGAWGILALVEDHKYNLSQLLVFEPNSRMSLFQLLSWSFITLGCATILVGICGCSAMFKNSRWILGLYIFLILAIFALDLATGLLAIIFQERLVANVRLKLVNKLRNEYGIQASFTAAIDYIQTRYECCGLDGHLDYDQSLWRLQRLGGFEATVARTCCHLGNNLDDQAHVNPRPVNESMCQSTDVRFHQSYRYRRGCLDDLERFIRHKIWTFTIGCGIVGGAILIVLALATWFCRSIPPGAAAANKKRLVSASRKAPSNRIKQQALAYAANVSKKQGHNYQHHGHHSTPSAHHK